MRKILLISVEADLDLMIEIGLKLRQIGYYVDILIGDRWNLFERKDLVRKALISNGFDDYSINLFESLYLELKQYANKKDPKTDWNYLGKFEEDHKDGYTLNQVLRSDFMVSNDFHSCKLYPFKGGSKHKYKFLELHLKKINNLLSEKKYDLFFSVSTQTIVKPIIYKIAKKNRIPFLTFEENRIESLWQIYTNFCRGTDLDMRTAMAELIKTGDQCLDAQIILDNFKKRKGALYYRFENNVNNYKKSLSFLFFLNALAWTIKHLIFNFYNNVKDGELYKISKYGMPTITSAFKYYLNNFLFIKWYQSKAYLNNIELPNNKYIYFPLHQMPESNTASQSEELNEYSCISNLSQKIPPDWIILVKLPPSMFSISGYTKSKYFFEDLIKIPSVKVMSPFFSSRELIVRSEAVACLAGTALFEAAILDKKGIYWGKPEFESINTLIHFSKFTIEEIYRPVVSNILFYIQASKNASLSIERESFINGIQERAPSINSLIDYITKCIEKFLKKV